MSDDRGALHQRFDAIDERFDTRRTRDVSVEDSVNGRSRRRYRDAGIDEDRESIDDATTLDAQARDLDHAIVL